MFILIKCKFCLSNAFILFTFNVNEIEMKKRIAAKGFDPPTSEL